MKRKQIAAHLDAVGEQLGHMDARATNGARLSQKEVDALRMGAAVGVAYAAMALELDATLDLPEIDAVSVMQVAVLELEEAKERKHG